MSSSPNNSSSNSAMDNFLVESLLDSLQVRDPVNNPLVSNTLEDYLKGDVELDRDREVIPYQEGREEVIMEEDMLEEEIIKIIDSGEGDSLMPNSGEAVSVLGHSICVDREESDHGDCMVWEWHGHIQACIEQQEGYQYSAEYFYGCYFQRVAPNTDSDASSDEEESKDHGLKHLIDEAEDSRADRILHRGQNIRSPLWY